jgi:hypothetical protein
MKAGPKASVDDSMLPFRPRSTGADRFAAFCAKFIKVPKGTGAGTPLRLRPWQRDLVGSVLDADRNLVRRGGCCHAGRASRRWWPRGVSMS